MFLRKSRKDISVLLLKPMQGHWLGIMLVSLQILVGPWRCLYCFFMAQPSCIQKENYRVRKNN